MRKLMIGILALCANQAFAATPASDVKARELRCLALNIYFEARGEAPEGQLAVALVSMNRVHSKRYPNSVCRVVWQPRQFSWTHDGKSDRPKEKIAWRLAQNIALAVYEKYHRLPAQARNAIDITRGALHYYAPKLAQPSWAKHHEVTRAIGGHVFLRKPS